jgi:hypothetical protein
MAAAFEEGLLAFRSGKRVEDNPYPEATASDPTTAPWHEWRRGWLIASTSGRMKLASTIRLK